MKKQLSKENELTMHLINKLVKAKSKYEYFVKLNHELINEHDQILSTYDTIHSENTYLKDCIKTLKEQEDIQRIAYKESLSMYQQREAKVDNIINYDLPQLLQSEYFLVVTNGNHKGDLFEGQIYKLLKKGGGARLGHFSNEWNKNFFTKPTIIKK